MAVLAALILLGGGFAFQKLFTRGETADFFPGSCLGTWQNPIFAQGQPETFSDQNVPLDEKNSAVFTGGDGQIFCGSFVMSSFEARGELTHVGLTLAWRMEGAAAEPIHESPIVSSTTSTVPLEPSAPTGTTDGTAATTTPESPSVFRLIPLAFAQEAAPEPSSSEPAPAAQSPAASEPSAPTAPNEPEADPEPQVIIAPPLQAQLSDDPTSTTIPTVDTSTQANVGGTGDAPVLSGPLPDDRFLKVEYSLNGQIWIELQRVGLENWQNFTIDLPVKSWEELQRVQIRIEGIPTVLSQVPKMYLDGMLLEAHYDIAPLLNTEGITANSTSSRISTEGGTVIETPVHGAPALVPPPQIVTSTQSEDRLTISVRFFGPFFGQAVNVYLYPHGTRAKRGLGGEQGYAFEEEPGPVFLDSVQLFEKDFTGEEHLATFDIIGPAVSEDYGIPTERMIPGKYRVDISYFDSQNWHLTPAQSFEWQ